MGRAVGKFDNHLVTLILACPQALTHVHTHVHIQHTTHTVLSAAALLHKEKRKPRL